MTRSQTVPEEYEASDDSEWYVKAAAAVPFVVPEKELKRMKHMFHPIQRIKVKDDGDWLGRVNIPIEWVSDSEGEEGISAAVDNVPAYTDAAGQAYRCFGPTGFTPGLHGDPASDDWWHRSF